jgi:hypothetical protein
VSRKTIGQREKLINEVEDLILRGVNRPATICRMVDGIGNSRTAARYIAAVSERWKVRNGVDNEAHRQRLLAEAQEIHRRAYAVVAQMSNLDHQTPAAGSAAATALGVALKALERQAKLLGLDSEKRIVDAGPDTLDAIREAKSLGFERVNAIVDLYAPVTDLLTGPTLDSTRDVGEPDFGLLASVP